MDLSLRLPDISQGSIQEQTQKNRFQEDYYEKNFPLLPAEVGSVSEPEDQ